VLARLLAKLLLSELPFGIRPLRIVATRLWIRRFVLRYIIGSARAVDRAAGPVTRLIPMPGEPDSD
jgi:hypothetical protein